MDFVIGKNKYNLWVWDNMRKKGNLNKFGVFRKNLFFVILVFENFIFDYRI